MYLDNKYTKWYFNIINKARTRKNIDGYFETHHIIPRSLGGTNEKSNLVNLLAKEHFVCHWLLTKMTTGKEKSKMVHALWIFTRSSKNQSREKITGKKYEILRKEFSQLISKKFKGVKKNWNMPESAKEKISRSSRGKPKSEATKIKMKEAWKFRPPRSKEHREALSKALIGKSLSEETKQKMSASHKGKTPTHTLIKFLCPHCGKEGVGIGNFKRWHGDNCKEIKNG